MNWVLFSINSKGNSVQYYKSGKSVKMTQSDDYKQRDVIKWLYKAKENVLQLSCAALSHAWFSLRVGS